jgi:hypothetical protein
VPQGTVAPSSTVVTAVTTVPAQPGATTSTRP